MVLKTRLNIKDFNLGLKLFLCKILCFELQSLFLFQTHAQERDENCFTHRDSIFFSGKRENEEAINDKIHVFAFRKRERQQCSSIGEIIADS